MLISQPVELKIKTLKKELDDYSLRHLNSLSNPPKAFLSQLFGFFLGNQEEETFQDDLQYGSGLTIQGDLPGKISVKEIVPSVEAKVDSSFKTPIIKILNREYLVVVTRSDLKLYFYSYTFQQMNQLQKKSRFAAMTAPMGSKHVVTKEIAYLPRQVFSSNESPGFHCVCAFGDSEGNQYLLLGGNRNVSTLFIDSTNFLLTLKLDDLHRQSASRRRKLR